MDVFFTAVDNVPDLVIAIWVMWAISEIALFIPKDGS